MIDKFSDVEKLQHRSLKDVRRSDESQIEWNRFLVNVSELLRFECIALELKSKTAFDS